MKVRFAQFLSTNGPNSTLKCCLHHDGWKFSRKNGLKRDSNLRHSVGKLVFFLVRLELTRKFGFCRKLKLVR
jgi:hypothetical protein